jgi:Major tropism determinant N-terminal domain
MTSVAVQRRREAASFLAAFIGFVGEILYDTTNRRLLVQDGQTPGGFPAYGVYAPNNSFLQPNVLEGNVETITTGGTTYATALQIPAGAILIGVSFRLNSAITGSTAWELGTSASPGQFATGLATALGTSKAIPLAPTVFSSATSLLLTSTAGGNFTGGNQSGAAFFHDRRAAVLTPITPPGGTSRARRGTIPPLQGRVSREA